MRNRKVIITGIVFLVAIFLIVISFGRGPFKTTPENNSYYKDNAYTGGVDFVDPDQTPETIGKNYRTLRNGYLLSSRSTNFFIEVRNRISEYAVANLGTDMELYIIKDSLVVENNKYTFVVEGGTSKTDINVVAYLTRQDTANVYINGEGPFSVDSPYFNESASSSPSSPQ